LNRSLYYMYVHLLESPVVTKEGNILSRVLVADQSGSIYLSLFDEVGEAIKPGDILSLDGYTSLYRGSLSLYVGRGGRIRRTGEIIMLFSEEPNMSTCKWIPDKNNPKMLIPDFSELVTTHDGDSKIPTDIYGAVPLPVSIVSAREMHKKRSYHENIETGQRDNNESDGSSSSRPRHSDSEKLSTDLGYSIGSLGGTSPGLFNEQLMAALVTASKLDPNVLDKMGPESLIALLHRPEIQTILSQLGHHPLTSSLAEISNMSHHSYATESSPIHMNIPSSCPPTASGSQPMLNYTTIPEAIQYHPHMAGSYSSFPDQQSSIPQPFIRTSSDFHPHFNP
jgi:hypothetical protein